MATMISQGASGAKLEDREGEVSSRGVACRENKHIERGEVWDEWKTRKEESSVEEDDELTSSISKPTNGPSKAAPLSFPYQQDEEDVGNAGGSISRKGEVEGTFKEQEKF